MAELEMDDSSRKLEEIEPDDQYQETEATQTQTRSSNVEADNPIFTENKDADKLKGDAIGNTLYSESGLLKTLISLSKFSEDSWSEQLEEQLCFLWDMTFEADVIAVLVKHDFIDLACHVIQNSSEPRLTEILVGILGNMTALTEVRCHLSQSITANMLFSLLSTSDTPTLLQLVRLLNSCVWHLNKGSHPSSNHDEDEHANLHAEVECWLTLLRDNAAALAKHLSFIFISSTNVELLQSALELLNNLCCITSNNFYFSELLSTAEIMQGVAEALHQLLSDETVQETGSYATTPERFSVIPLWGESSEKAAQHWSQAISTFTLHDPGIEVLYHQRQNIMRSICSILDPLGLRANILPLDTRKLEILDSIMDVLECFQRKHSYTPPAILPRVLTLMPLLIPAHGEQDDDKEETEKEENLLNCAEIQRRIYTYCLTVLCDTETSDFLDAFGDEPLPKVKTLLSNLTKCQGDGIQKVVNIIQKHLLEIQT